MTKRWTPGMARLRIEVKTVLEMIHAESSNLLVVVSVVDGWIRQKRSLKNQNG
jgi:hypothetical protein